MCKIVLEESVRILTVAFKIHLTQVGCSLQRMHALQEIYLVFVFGGKKMTTESSENLLVVSGISDVDMLGLGLVHCGQRSSFYLESCACPNYMIDSNPVLIVN